MIGIHRIVRDSAALALLALGLPSPLLAQTVRGVVLDLDGTPLGGAEVLLATRTATTNADGEFRVDQVAPGRYNLTVRLIGYHPGRTRVEVSATDPVNLEIRLVRAPTVLPPVIVEGRRIGLYGVVGDTAFRPLAGAQVQLLGEGGGATRTDSLGRFAFSDADGGDYLVRVSLAGHRERRFSVRVEPGRGREVTVTLVPADRRYRAPGRGELWALRDLDQRLAWSFDRFVLSREELARFGSISLCDIPEIRSTAGIEPIGIVDGWRTFHNICSVRADEVELVEWGSDLCREPTGTAAAMFRTECTRLRTRTGARVRGPGYVLVWQVW
jgi:hypothetical protein